MKTALVCGAGGFIGGHLVNRLKSEGFRVLGADLVENEFGNGQADLFFKGDLRDFNFCKSLFAEPVHQVYQLAADMGGAGYVFTGNHDADIMHNSAMVNLHLVQLSAENRVEKIFYSSSACMYPEYNQMDPDNPKCAEDTAYPAAPDSEYGWEKLFSERLYLSFQRNYGLQVRIGRFHNIYGPLGTWKGGKEKAPAAICRKVAEAENNGAIEIWGDGLQTRSFLYIDDCIEAVRRLMESDFTGPVNIGSEEMVTINQLAQIAMDAAGKSLTLNHIAGPEGVRGRNSDNKLISQQLGWQPKWSLKEGIGATYQWIANQLAKES